MKVLSYLIILLLLPVFFGQKNQGLKKGQGCLCQSFFTKSPVKYTNGQHQNNFHFADITNISSNKNIILPKKIPSEFLSSETQSFYISLKIKFPRLLRGPPALV